ncbi:MAG: sigma-70 family RNA polymerase sigma factor [Ahniella sp.]|nr:sigma-70 family RNA polymerase sigma factor [Ahniella sp.]
MAEVTELLERARQGDPLAWNQVVELIYDDLKRVARGVLAGRGSATFNPTVLVHDCYLRLARAGAHGVQDRAHFMALAARAMRQLLLNHARDRMAQKRGAGAVVETLSEEERSADLEAEHLLGISTALEQLEAIEPKWVQVVECRVFAGLSEQETADALGTSLRTVQRWYAEARVALARIMAPDRDS